MGQSQLLRIGSVFLGASLFLLFFWLEVDTHFNLQFLREQRVGILKFYLQNRIVTYSLYLILYVTIVSFSFPGATILTLAGGAIFGVGIGTVLALMGATIGASFAFLMSRYLLGSFVRQKFSASIDTINRGIEKEGVFYLFMLRMVPAFPFFAVNCLMGLTRLKLRTFVFVSLIGMIPGTFVYVTAGVTLNRIESISGIMSPQIFLYFVVIGFLPFILKKSLGFLKSRLF